jgi:pimeloyl-ACP methyl ester carboxylesterase
MLVVVPTLVIWGKHDRFLLNGNLDGLQDYVPRVQIEWISDGSHWVVHEQPERIVRLIASFVAEISGTSIN